MLFWTVYLPRKVGVSWKYREHSKMLRSRWRPCSSSLKHPSLYQRTWLQRLIQPPAAESGLQCFHRVMHLPWLDWVQCGHWRFCCDFWWCGKYVHSSRQKRRPESHSSSRTERSHTPAKLFIYIFICSTLCTDSTQSLQTIHEQNNKAQKLALTVTVAL